MHPPFFSHDTIYKRPDVIICIYWCTVDLQTQSTKVGIKIRSKPGDLSQGILVAVDSSIIAEVNHRVNSRVYFRVNAPVSSISNSICNLLRKFIRHSIVNSSVNSNADSSINIKTE